MLLLNILLAQSKLMFYFNVTKNFGWVHQHQMSHSRNNFKITLNGKYLKREFNSKISKMILMYVSFSTQC
jgi:hypothetical protein